MILDAILAILFGLVEGVLSLFPAYTLPSSVPASFSSLGATASGLNGIFPVGTLGVCIGIVIAFRVVIALVQLLVWVWDLIPFKAT